MPDIKDSVGQGGLNKGHDVALVQALLQIVKNAKGHSYLTAGYDGAYGNVTKQAIVAFQKDQKLLPALTPPAGQAVQPPPPVQGPKAAVPAVLPAAVVVGAQAPAGAAAAPAAKVVTEKEGFIAPGGPTMQKLNSLLPLEYKGLRIVAGTKLVYWPGSAGAASDSAKAIRADAGLEGIFRENVAKLVELLYQRHEIVLSLPPTGGLRTFQKQYELATQPDPPTGAGPGESNHNFGLAVDIGPRGFKWLASNLIAKTEAGWWLGDLSNSSPAKFMEMWGVRNQIAFSELGMFPSALAGDHVHVQKFSDANVSMSRSLAHLLNQVGAMKWQFGGGQYKCDFGLGGAFYPVGIAERVWEGNGAVTKEVLEKAYKAVNKKDAVTPAAVTEMKAKLKADFVTAETKRFQWQPKQ
jgi:peptidoglycan hydrolase-like protein with peptidoglycan-binding domain